MRQCKGCEKEKPAKEFYRSKTGPGGRMPICKDCSRGRSGITNRALAILRDRHRDEYLEIRKALQA